jgi:hypothetical protein
MPRLAWLIQRTLSRFVIVGLCAMYVLTWVFIPPLALLLTVIGVIYGEEAAKKRRQ